MTDRSMAFGDNVLLRNLLRFGRVLRALGLDVHAGRLRHAVEALEAIDLRRRSDVRHALRTTLVHRAEDLVRFDAAFDVFWRRRAGGWRSDVRPLGVPQETARRAAGTPLVSPDAGPYRDEDSETARREPAVIGIYSARDVLRTKDFGNFSSDELEQARAMLASLTWDPGPRRTRRWESGCGERLDLRQVARRSVRVGGELLDLPRRRPRERPRTLIVVCDVSGSMERYSRMLLHFIHAVGRGRGRVESFVFATRLTRITKQLKGGDIDRAIAAVAAAVPDWSGGTRIGEALRAFNVSWARRVLGRRAVVLLISDGWDRGEPGIVALEMARLQRSCNRLIWLNPLLGSASYEPVTRGMRAARPFIDDFLPAHNMSSLEALASHLNALPACRPPRRQQTQRATWS